MLEVPVFTRVYNSKFRGSVMNSHFKQILVIMIGGFFASFSFSASALKINGGGYAEDNSSSFFGPVPNRAFSISAKIVDPGNLAKEAEGKLVRSFVSTNGELLTIDVACIKSVSNESNMYIISGPAADNSGDFFPPGTVLDTAVIIQDNGNSPDERDKISNVWTRPLPEDGLFCNYDSYLLLGFFQQFFPINSLGDLLFFDVKGNIKVHTDD